MANNKLPGGVTPEQLEKEAAEFEASLDYFVKHYPIKMAGLGRAVGMSKPSIFNKLDPTHRDRITPEQYVDLVYYLDEMRNALNVILSKTSVLQEAPKKSK